MLVLVAFRNAITELVNEGAFKIENAVAMSGIGCHGKITEYLNMNTLTSLHGRVIPMMTGAKVANPELTIFGFSGDGDSYDEGMSHLVHAARRNSDINLFIHDNQLFALTTGQANPTSPFGTKGKSTPFGSIEHPLNTLHFMLSAGATFVARTYAGDIEGTKKIMKAAALHKGFSFVSIVQPCITFADTREAMKEKIYWIDENFPRDNKEEAMKKVQENDGRVALGIFYNESRETFEELVHKN
jgi:2-oxoglutarate ferredoxin oxidoreductase subunit beta